MIRFSCPSCHVAVCAPEDCGGRTTKCRQCGHQITIPALGQIVSSTPTVLGKPRSTPRTKPTPRRPRGRYVVLAFAAIIVVFGVATLFRLISPRGVEGPAAQKQEGPAAQKQPANNATAKFEDEITRITRHGFWESSVKREDIEKVLELMSSHAKGTVFLNSAGKSVWNYSSREDALTLHADAESTAPGISALGGKRVLIPLNEAAAASRLDRRVCLMLLRDAISSPTFEQLYAQNPVAQLFPETKASPPKAKVEGKPDPASKSSPNLKQSPVPAKIAKEETANNALVQALRNRLDDLTKASGNALLMEEAQKKHQKLLAAWKGKKVKFVLTVSEVRRQLPPSSRLNPIQRKLKPQPKEAEQNLPWVVVIRPLEATYTGSFGVAYSSSIKFRFNGASGEIALESTERDLGLAKKLRADSVIVVSAKVEEIRPVSFLLRLEGGLVDGLEADVILSGVRIEEVKADQKP